MGQPANLNVTMPPEWWPHERTFVAWPTRDGVWGETLSQAKREYAGVINAIAAFEPVTVVVCPGGSQEVRAACTGSVNIIEREIDDSWLRDNGPIFAFHRSGQRFGVDFQFNAWGKKFLPYDADAAVAKTLVEEVGDSVLCVDMVLEGGSIAVGTEQTLLTTEQCLLHPNRNPELTKDDIEKTLCNSLGMERVIWLGNGLVEDRDTDGHVDLIAVPLPCGKVLLQVVDDPEDENYRHCQENKERLLARGIDVIELNLLPKVQVAGEQVAVSYCNLYLCNGAVIIPQSGSQEADEQVLHLLAGVFPGREIVGVEAAVIAYGGGGPHCITQQVPAICSA